MDRLRVSHIVEKKIKRGISLLEARDFPTTDLTDGIVTLENQAGSPLGVAYLSPQQKGIGWFITEKQVEIDTVFFQDLFQKAKLKRQAFSQSDLTTAYRVFNQDGDGFGGVTIDLYGDYALFSWYNAFVFSIKDMLLSAFRLVFPEIKGGYEKIRFQGAHAESSHLYGEEAPDSFLIKENGVFYQVFLNDGLMTGIFLDQHHVRGQLIDGLAAGKSVLNMFSYTAAFSIAAAVGGAASTTSVDLAKRSRDLSLAHFQANGLSLENHQLLVMDVFAYFKYAKRHQLFYDVIILDPPSFARNKKQTFSVAKDYHQLVAQALEILQPEGILIASTNAANLSLEKFKKQIEKGLGKTAYDYLGIHRLPIDFVYNKNDESSNYLKVFTIQVHK